MGIKVVKSIWYENTDHVVNITPVCHSVFWLIKHQVGLNHKDNWQKVTSCQYQLSRINAQCQLNDI